MAQKLERVAALCGAAHGGKKKLAATLNKQAEKRLPNEYKAAKRGSA